MATGTLPEGHTNLSSIYFYAGVKLDPTEQRWYIKEPPSTFDQANGMISDYWTRAEFEAEVLTPHEVQKLRIPESMFQNPGKQIYHPYPLSDFILTNVNFVKVVNRDENGEKIFYGFINSVTYDNDGNTVIDWSTAEFYTNLFNGIKFNYAQITKAHNRLSNAAGRIIDETQYRVKENLSSGDTLIPQEPFKIAPDTVDKIRFWVCEIYISGKNPTRNIDSIDIGYPSSRAYIVIPFDRTANGEVYNIVDSTGTMVNGGIGAHLNLGELLLKLSIDASWQANGVTVGQMGITYSIGSKYTIDAANKNVVLHEGGAKFGLLAATASGLNLPVMHSAGIGEPLVKEYSGGLYQMLLEAIKNSTDGAAIQSFFGARGGIPEKLTHFVGVNFLDGDALIGSFTADEVKKSVNDNLKINMLSSPHQFSRVDLFVEPYSDGHQKDTTPALMRKFTNQRNSSVPFADNAWATYSFLNQNQMQNAKNVIDTSQSITESQNQFNRNQAGVQADQNRARANMQNSQALDYTTQTANQQLGMQSIQSAIATGKSGAQEAFRAGTGVIGGGVGGLLGGALNQAGPMTGAALGYQNTLANQNLSNAQNISMVGLQNQQSLALADNTLNFSNKIAARTAKQQRDTLEAGWADMKLQPAAVVSGGSESEYLAHMYWDYPTGVFSLPTSAILFSVGRYLMEFGNEVNIYDKIQKYMFTRKVMNYIQTTDCSIEPSSNISNSVRVQIEMAFNRGVQIWHNLDKMARLDYTGNDYA